MSTTYIGPNRVVMVSGMDYLPIEEVLMYLRDCKGIHPRCDAHYWQAICDQGLVVELKGKWMLTVKGTLAIS